MYINCIPYKFFFILSLYTYVYEMVFKSFTELQFKIHLKSENLVLLQSGLSKIVSIRL